MILQSRLQHFAVLQLQPEREMHEVFNHFLCFSTPIMNVSKNTFGQHIDASAKMRTNTVGVQWSTFHDMACTGPDALASIESLQDWISRDVHSQPPGIL